MSAMREALDDYLTIRRQLGFKLESDGRLLERFVSFVEQSSESRVTTELAVAWARQPVGVKPHRWRQRLGTVRGFARYLATIDPQTEVPPIDLLPARQERIAPYIYSPAEIEMLMSAAGARSDDQDGRRAVGSDRHANWGGARARRRGHRPR
jgi:integrase/recombinase XerD